MGKSLPVDPNVTSVLLHVDVRHHKHEWDPKLLALNGVMRPPTENALKAAIEAAREDETRAFDNYSNRDKLEPLKFSEIVEDASRGDFWERLGFNLNAAYHYAAAAEIAHYDGAEKWSRKLLDKAISLYGAWSALGKADPVGLNEKLAKIKEIIGI